MYGEEGSSESRPRNYNEGVGCANCRIRILRMRRSDEPRVEPELKENWK